ARIQRLRFRALGVALVRRDIEAKPIGRMVLGARATLVTEALVERRCVWGSIVGRIVADGIFESGDFFARLARSEHGGQQYRAQSHGFFCCLHVPLHIPLSGSLAGNSAVSPGKSLARDCREPEISTVPPERRSTASASTRTPLNEMVARSIEPAGADSVAFP